MSLDAIHNKIKKAKEEISKQEKLLEKKLSKIVSTSGMMDLDISEKDLKTALTHFVGELKKKSKPTQPNNDQQSVSKE